MAGKIKSITIKSVAGEKLIKIKRVKDGYDVVTLSSVGDMDILIVDDTGRVFVPIRRAYERPKKALP